VSVARILLTAGLEIALTLGAVFLVERSLEGALKAVKFALKSEFSTDTGRVNLVGMILLVFFLVFSNLHEAATRALSVEKPAPAENYVLVPEILFFLGFLCSLICVLIMERKNR